MLYVVMVALVGAFALSAALSWTVRQIARRVGFIDKPGGHKAHETPVALGGGIAIYWAITLPLLAVSLAAYWLNDSERAAELPPLIAAHLSGAASKLPLLLAVLGGGLVLHVMGLIDDVRPLGPWPKFAVQFAVAIALVWGVDVRAAEALGAAPSIVLTVLWIVLITNAFNFLDNIDGLSAGVAGVCASVFAISAMIGGQIFVPLFAWVVVGAALGFLVFNFNPASMFMGDAGSTVLGYFLAVLTVLITYYDPGRQQDPVGLLMPIVVLAVPLYDVASVLIHRWRAGVSPLRGDRRHFSHRLVRRGMNTRLAVLTIYLATLATSLPAMLLPTADWQTGWIVMAQTICVLLIIAVLEHAPLPMDRDSAKPPSA